MVGSPAYAPRSYDGPASEAAPFQDPSQFPPTLSFPSDSTALASARNSYLPHGQEPGTKTYDNLALPPATEGTSGSAPDLTTSNPAATTDSSGSTSGSDSSSGSSGSSTSTGVSKTAYVPGAPIDVWDTDWPAGGYYWTVIPVRLSSKGAMNTTVAAFASVG